MASLYPSPRSSTEYESPGRVSPSQTSNTIPRVATDSQHLSSSPQLGWSGGGGTRSLPPTAPSNGRRQSRLNPKDASPAMGIENRLLNSSGSSVHEDLPQKQHPRISSRLPSSTTPSRSRQRRTRRTWRRLLWVKQTYPDNYTDHATFLESLQRNPRLQPYDFWPLFADTTLIVQHVCTVIIFISCFIAIFQERVSPVSVMGFGTLLSLIGWIIWERWAARAEFAEEAANVPGAFGSSTTGSLRRRPTLIKDATRPSLTSLMTPITGSPASATNEIPSITTLTPTSSPSVPPVSTHSVTPCTTTDTSNSSSSASSASFYRRKVTPSSLGKNGNTTFSSSSHDGSSRMKRYNSEPLLSVPPKITLSSSQAVALESTSTTYTSQSEPFFRQKPILHQRLSTIKSAVLIYSTVLGLSPILKSLTRSTSSDSVWTLCFFLLLINIFSFDYSGGLGAKFPASLSTNAALMASTMLASRLPSTGQVFSLTMFSIEVFGLFPVFRRYARHRSWRYHVGLTGLLVVGAGASVGIVVSALHTSHEYLLWNAVKGIVVASAAATLAMGGCSWWLISLQKYKNEIYGPWDPARPIVSRRFWNS